MKDLPPQFFEDIGYIKRAVEQIDDLDKKVDKISKKVNYIYAWASGVAFVSTFFIIWIKEKVFGVLR